jgi:hypothetical protein
VYENVTVQYAPTHTGVGFALTAEATLVDERWVGEAMTANIAATRSTAIRENDVRDRFLFNSKRRSSAMYEKSKPSHFSVQINRNLVPFTY